MRPGGGIWEYAVPQVTSLSKAPGVWKPGTGQALLWRQAGPQEGRGRRGSGAPAGQQAGRVAPLSLGHSHTGNRSLHTGKGVQAQGRELLWWRGPAASWGERAPGGCLKGQLVPRRLRGGTPMGFSCLPIGANPAEGPLEGPRLHIRFPGPQRPEGTSEQQNS